MQPPPQKKTQPCSDDDFDSLANRKLALTTSRCEKRKCFQALPHVLPVLRTITFCPYSGFFFFPLSRLFFCSLPCCRHKGSSLVLLKMTTMSSVSYFHVIYNWDPPSSKKKKKSVGKGRREHFVGPQGFPLIGWWVLGLKKYYCFVLLGLEIIGGEGKAVIRKFTELLSN